MPPSVLKGIQSLLSGIQSTLQSWQCPVLLPERGYGLNCSGRGLCLPSFWGAVLVLLIAVWEVSGVYLHVSWEGSVSFWTRTPVLSLLPWRWASPKLLLGPQPSRPHCISQRLCPVLTASGQGTQPSACPVPPAQPCPGFPLRTHSWPPVIAAYLLSCHRCWVCVNSAEPGQ